MDTTDCMGGNRSSGIWFSWVVITENKTTEKEWISNWMRDKMAIYGGSLSVWSVFANMILCVAFLALIRNSSLLKHKMNSYDGGLFKWLAVSLSVTQVVIGAVIIPVKLMADSTESWPFGAIFCRAWLLLQLLPIANTVWILVIMTGYCLFQMMGVRLIKGRVQKGLIGVLCCVLPLLLSVISLLPLVIAMARSDSVAEEKCAVSMTTNDVLIMSFAVFWFPVGLLLTGSAAILTMMIQQYKAGANKEGLEATGCEKASSSGTLVAVNLTWGSLLAPFFVVYTVTPYCSEMCVDPSVWSITVWLGFTSVGVLPLVWCISSDVRQQLAAFKSIVCRRGPKDSQLSLYEHPVAILTREV